MLTPQEIEDFLGEDVYDPEFEAWQQAKGEEIKQYLREQHEDLITRALGSANGRAVLWWVLSLTRLFHSPADAHIHRETGRADVGREILAEVLRIHPEAFILMQSEQTELRERLQGMVSRDTYEAEQERREGLEDGG